jgi:hypothetical protein
MPTQQPIVMEGSPVVTALEDAWATIRRHHPELPEVFIVVGAGGPLARTAASRWAHPGPPGRRHPFNLVLEVRPRQPHRAS